MQMKPEDLRIDTFRTGGSSGWITKPDVGVRILHVPTGIEVTESEDRSIHRNKAVAMEKLTALVEKADPVPPKLSEVEELRAKLQAARDALALADTIMDICGGDAYERECAEPIRDEYRAARDRLDPPPPPKPYALPLAKVKNSQPKKKCPSCGKTCGGDEGLRAHNKAKHGNSGLVISSISQMRKAIP